ncbi:Phospholipid/glycerol acyltransferase domain-containing protein [Pleurotus pulmonarius]
MHGAEKGTLQQALSMAQEAVKLDTAKDSHGAVRAYIQSITTLDTVIQRLTSSSQPDELQRVTSIRDTYIERSVLALHVVVGAAAIVSRLPKSCLACAVKAVVPPPPRSKSPPAWLKAIQFILIFDLGCLLNNACHFMLLPIRILPFRCTRGLYDEGIRYTKGAFGCLLILACQWFAPTTLRITFEEQGQGRLTESEIDQIVARDESGKVIGLKLPKKSVLIANHQMYADWWYAWCLAYFMDAQKDVFIVLKKSLKWLPIVGWGMQFFRFIFLARSWASDRVALARQLSRLGKQAQEEDKPFLFLLYPEGTLVSKDTRPISKKFAEKQGIPDMKHTLLPRSTGLHHSLRSLVPRIPQLKLIDATVVYPGIPPMGYGQTYYTLRSIFMNGVPPPVIHIHLRVFDVQKEVPIGDLSSSNPSALPNPSSRKNTVETDIPEAEKAKFDLWLRNLWREKDLMFDAYHSTKRFASGGTTAPVDIPVRLRSSREVWDAFCFFLPMVLATYVWRKIV